MLSQDTNLKQKQFKVKGLLRPAPNPSLQIAMHSPRQKFIFSITDLLAPLAIHRPTRGGQDWLISDTHGDCGHWFWCWLSIIFLSRWYVGSPAVVLILPVSAGRKPGILAPFMDKEIEASGQGISHSPHQKPLFYLISRSMRVSSVVGEDVQSGIHFGIIMLITNTYWHLIKCLAPCLIISSRLHISHFR